MGPPPTHHSPHKLLKCDFAGTVLMHGIERALIGNYSAIRELRSVGDEVRGRALSTGLCGRRTCRAEEVWSPDPLDSYHGALVGGVDHV
jgi:hypothetical protein